MPSKVTGARLSTVCAETVERPTPVTLDDFRFVVLFVNPGNFTGSMDAAFIPMVDIKA